MDRADSVTVGVLGSYGGRNVGDEAILTALLDRVRAGRPETRFVVFSRDPGHTRRVHPDVEVAGWEGLCREGVSAYLRRLSALVLGGGGILYDTEARRCLRMARTAQDLDVPVFTYAVGAGPLTDEVDCARVRPVLSDAVEVTVRDEESKLVLEAAGLTRPVSVTADPALLLAPGDQGGELLRAEAVPRGVRLVGMSVREPGRAAEHLDEDGYHQLLAGVGDFLVHRLDAHIVFVSMERGDIRHAHAVASRMASADRCTVLRGDYAPQQVLDIVAPAGPRRRHAAALSDLRRALRHPAAAPALRGQGLRLRPADRRARPARGDPGDDGAAAGGSGPSVGRAARSGRRHGRAYGTAAASGGRDR
ncbi:hypothetical protein GCM10010260_29250 [Streptomyces filipinensis]|uniref:Polysaccharide pyruvyl transferase domain-containing protein n=1 Tax=Streptomyces filipinensis TaxID=66887 RepID=A0A918IBP1_9ACTN|nr:polysaccharide pyruvyl transferase family protein [Streptomyces filipinensis]GGU92671.1 hypothetical protein GCM10010260_29250 [Streptomyces filipinensis]